VVKEEDRLVGRRRHVRSCLGAAKSGQFWVPTPGEGRPYVFRQLRGVGQEVWSPSTVLQALLPSSPPDSPAPRPPGEQGGSVPMSATHPSQAFGPMPENPERRTCSPQPSELGRYGVNPRLRRAPRPPAIPLEPHSRLVPGFACSDGIVLKALRPCMNISMC
jgi:hypothetical protein